MEAPFNGGCGGKMSEEVDIRIFKEATQTYRYSSGIKHIVWYIYRSVNNQTRIIMSVLTI